VVEEGKLVRAEFLLYCVSIHKIRIWCHERRGGSEVGMRQKSPCLITSGFVMFLEIDAC
jgi:hypothetical protein